MRLCSVRRRLCTPCGQAALGQLPPGELVGILKFICQCTPAGVGLRVPGDGGLSDVATSSDEARPATSYRQEHAGLVCACALSKSF